MNTISLYVVKVSEDAYFAGFDPVDHRVKTVSNPYKAKMFSNKYEIKLRPTEMLVEMEIVLDDSNTFLSEPFRPVRRVHRK